MSQPPDRQPPDRRPEIDTEIEVGRVEAGGQVTGAQVGQVTGSLTVRNNIRIGAEIIQIGRVVVPVRLILALVAAPLLLAVAAWFLFVPAQMTNPFNVAVADFGLLDPSGRVQESGDGDMLSRWTFDGLRGQFETLPPQAARDFRPLVWHDSLGFLSKRALIGRVAGQTPQAREKEAARLAREIGADILFYGNLAAAAPGAAPGFNLEFYVSPRLRGATDEIIGVHQLGAPIPVQLPLKDEPESRVRLNMELTSRASSLSRLALGLMYVLVGVPDEASRIFQQANDQVAGSGVQEIMLFLIGEQALFADHDVQALAAFQQALAINPRYTRAQIGVGSVYFTRATRIERDDPAKMLDSPELDRAIAEYQKATSFDALAGGASSSAVAHLALGAAFRLKGEALLYRRDYAAADALYDGAIAEISPTLAALSAGEQQRLLAQAYLGLGSAYHEKAYIREVQGAREESKALYRQAVDFYDRCVKQGEASPKDAILREKVIDQSCAPFKKQAGDALAALQAAK